MLNSIYIEITDACNLNCSFCPCGCTTRHDRTFMGSALFERCIQQAALHAENVYFHILGEPTLHPGFIHYLKALETTPLKLNLTTNGTTIARVGKQMLQSPALRQVNFSTHAYGELGPDQAQAYLQDVLDFCQMALAERPDLYLNLRLWNAGDFPDANRQRGWNRLMLARVAQTFGLDGKDILDPEHFCSRHKSFPVQGRLYLHQDSRFEWPSLDERRDSTGSPTLVQGTCHGLETHVGILHDGRDLIPCRTPDGKCYLIQAKYLKPIADSAGLRLSLRHMDGEGRPYITAKDGMFLTAIISPVAPKENAIEWLQDVSSGIVRARSYEDEDV